MLQATVLVCIVCCLKPVAARSSCSKTLFGKVSSRELVARQCVPAV